MNKAKQTKFFVLMLFLISSFTIFAQPTITQQPVNQSVTEGSQATFSVTATSAVPITYQWIKGVTPIAGATNNSYTTPPTVLGDDGSVFHCAVTDTGGTTLSASATLTVSAGIAPVITVQPTDKYILTGQTATFSVTATGTAPLTYQWKKNNTNISGATGSNYTTPAAVLADNAANFVCVVTNSFGTVTSDVASLSVADASSRIINGLQVLYNFKEGSGTTINDVSNVGTELDLTIDDLELASWTDEGLNIHGNSRIKSSNIATKLIDACKSTNEITFEAWVLPSNLTTRSLHTRLFTIGKDDYHKRNFGVVQHKNEVYYLLRNSNSADLNGDVLGYDTISVGLTHIAVTRKSDGTVKLYENGVEVESLTLSGDFSNWADDFRIFLGNDAASDYFWEGTYYLTAVFNRALNGFEIQHNYNMGVNVDEVPSFTVSPQDQFVVENEVATFSALAVSVNPVSYQWRKNGTNIPGATQSTLVFQTTSADGDAEFTCVATSASGSRTSAPARLNLTTLNSRVTAGQHALYTFREGTGTTINDVSMEGTPFNLSIFSSEAVNWNKDGIELIAPASISSTAPANKVVNAIKASNALTVEAWVKAANTTQDGPASILNLSADASNRDFSLAQTADSFNVRLRTTTTNMNGEPSVSSAPGSVNITDFDHVVYTRNSLGVAKLFINGTERVSTTVAGNFSNWDSYFIGLGNEIGGGAPWLGTINLIAIFDRAISQTEILRNYDFGPYGVVNNPTDLVLVSNEIGEISFSWTDNSQNEEGFIVERGVGSPLVYTALDTLIADSTSFTDMNVVDNMNYTYRVLAFNSIGISGYSNELVVTSKISPIEAPSDLQYTYNSEGYPIITWTDNSDNETGFKLERRVAKAGSSFILIDSVLADVTTFEDLTVSDSTSYVYRIYAFNPNAVSSFSGEKIVDIGFIVGVESVEQIPTEYTLSQNYPNPFNPSTKIKFSLPEKSNVSISIFNMLGQKVADLLNGDYAAGYHEVNFNASNLTSGIYIYSIVANGSNGKAFKNTKKMLLLK